MKKNNEPFFDFETLVLYQKALDYIDFVYEISLKFPKEEIYNLTSQFKRAANSIALNIGEGYGESFALSLRYLRISKGSVRECLVCSTIACRRNYINSLEYEESKEKLVELSKLASGYKKYLNSKIK